MKGFVFRVTTKGFRPANDSFAARRVLIEDCSYVRTMSFLEGEYATRGKAL